MEHQRGKPWTDAEIAEIVSLFRDGKTTAQVADEMGVMSDRLRKVMKENGIGHFLQPRHIWKAAEETELINDFENGMPLDEMAKKFGISKSSIYCRLRSAANRRGITLKRYWKEYFRRRCINLNAD